MTVAEFVHLIFLYQFMVPYKEWYSFNRVDTSRDSILHDPIVNFGMKILVLI